jgi:subtilisin family serine protease
MSRLFFILIFSSVLISCLESEAPSESNKGGGSEDTYTPEAAIIFSGDITFKEDIYSEVDVRDFLNLGVGTYTFSKDSGPSWISINATTGIISGTPDNSGQFNAAFRATKVGDTQTTGSLSIAVNGDPLKDYSWHIINTGQKSFASRSGTSGFDINLQGVHAEDITGEGIKIVVSDTGVEVNHDDLINNMLAGLHKNYTTTSPYYGLPVASSAHGTAVSGIIAAEGWNNIGSLGIAPKAKIAAYQFLDSSQSTSILIDQASGNYDIFNYSYGDVIYRDTLSDADYIDHLRWATKNQRSGLGSFHVKAAGNEFINLDDYSNPSVCAAHNANAPFENESPFMILVGAINADGERATYSNAGSNLWLSAPGGEYGAMDPAIISTDLPTCFKGYSKASDDITNSFEYGHNLNQKCNYTSTMNGTSSAAPIVSGAIALLLDANPNLSYRDVKHILAVTAEKVDATISAWPGKNHPSNYIVGCPDLSLSGHSYEQDWITNNAGLHFHNFYGFGNLDISAAVAMAKNTATDPLGWLPMPTLIETNAEFNVSAFDSGVVNATITDNDAGGVSDSINISTNYNVEQIQIKVSITHPRSGEVGLELTSPSGTKSILKYVNDSFLIDDDANLNMVLLSNAFYGESSQGNWTLKAIDGKNGNTGILSRWKINIIGHTP